MNARQAWGGTSCVNSIGEALAAARLRGSAAAPVDLRRIGSLDEAIAIQTAAASAYGADPLGYTLSGTSAATLKLLGCDGPIVGRVFAQDRLPAGSALAVQPGMLGIGAEFSFVFGRSFPHEESDRADPESVADAIAVCHVGLQALARRVPHAVPLNRWTGTADFGLAHTYVEGPMVQDWRSRLTPAIPVRLLMDRHACGEGNAGDLMGHPLAAVAYLVKDLIRRDRLIEAGDVVATGSVTGLAQLIPGRVVVGDFGELGSVELRLT